MGLSSSKDVNNLIKEAEEQGWVITRNNSNHLKWVSPTGQAVFSSSTPSDHRVVFKIKRDLRMYGFVEIKRKKARRGSK